MKKLEVLTETALFAACEDGDHDICDEVIYYSTKPFQPGPEKKVMSCVCVCHELPDVLTPLVIEDFLNG